MKKLLSVKYSATVFNITFLLLRLVFGTAMLANHGYGKLVHFADRKDRFVDFLGMGSPATLALVIFAVSSAPSLSYWGCLPGWQQCRLLLQWDMPFLYQTQVTFLAMANQQPFF